MRRLLVVSLLLLSACQGQVGSSHRNSTNDDDQSTGDDQNDDSDSDAGAGDDGNHPLIYLNATNRARLTTMLDAGDPRATRLRNLVNSVMHGGDDYGFEAWWATLLYQLTDDVSYGDFAVSR